MTPQDRKRLEGIARSLQEALSTVRELLAVAEPVASRAAQSEVRAETQALLASLRREDRPTAEARLNELKHNDLGALFVEAGGPPSEKKKPKVWLVEQILWRIFDFERGHEVIRSKGERES
jgi:hypothetical protein